MKKLLLALSLTMAFSFGTQAVMAECGTCSVPKNDCTKPTPTCEKSCEKPSCQDCGDLAKMKYSNCKDKMREEIYCRLNLDSCQRAQAMEIENRYDDDLDCIEDKMKSDHKCLCDKINASCLDKTAVRDAERTLRQDIKDFKSKLKEMDKDFKEILKCDQKSDYRKIKRELKYKAKHSMKYCCKCSK